MEENHDSSFPMIHFFAGDKVH